MPVCRPVFVFPAAGSGSLLPPPSRRCRRRLSRRESGHGVSSFPVSILVAIIPTLANSRQLFLTQVKILKIVNTRLITPLLLLQLLAKLDQCTIKFGTRLSPCGRSRISRSPVSCTLALRRALGCSTASRRFPKAPARTGSRRSLQIRVSSDIVRVFDDNPG